MLGAKQRGRKRTSRFSFATSSEEITPSITLLMRSREASSARRAASWGLLVEEPDEVSWDAEG